MWGPGERSQEREVGVGRGVWGPSGGGALLARALDPVGLGTDSNMQGDNHRGWEGIADRVQEDTPLL